MKKLLINSDDCILDNYDYIVKTNLNVSSFNLVKLENITTTSLIYNVTEYNNTFVLTEKSSNKTIISIPIGCYTQYLSLCSSIFDITKCAISKSQLQSFI